MFPYIFYRSSGEKKRRSSNLLRWLVYLIDLVVDNLIMDSSVSVKGDQWNFPVSRYSRRCRIGENSLRTNPTSLFAFEAEREDFLFFGCQRNNDSHFHYPSGFRVDRRGGKRSGENRRCYSSNGKQITNYFYLV